MSTLPMLSLILPTPLKGVHPLLFLLKSRFGAQTGIIKQQVATQSWNARHCQTLSEWAKESENQILLLQKTVWKGKFRQQRTVKTAYTEILKCRISDPLASWLSEHIMEVVWLPSGLRGIPCKYYHKVQMQFMKRVHSYSNVMIILGREKECGP